MVVGDNTANNYVAVSATGGALVDQGAAAAAAGAWPVEITDGTNILGTSAHPVRVDPTGTTVQPVTVSTVALTPASPTAASVGVTSASAVAANASRTGLVLINTSNNTISLGLGAAAVLSSGITLNPNGGTWEMDNFSFYRGAINAIASGASSNMAIQEFS